MSIASMQVVLDRISTAKEYSPIAVFIAIKSGKKKLDAVFGSTIVSNMKIKVGDKSFVGIFDENDDIKSVKQVLMAATK